MKRAQALLTPDNVRKGMNGRSLSWGEAVFMENKSYVLPPPQPKSKGQQENHQRLGGLKVVIPSRCCPQGGVGERILCLQVYHGFLEV